jgi:hypothetical protein
VGGRLLVALLGARALYRVAALVSSAVLLEAWGEDDFAPYAAALGIFNVVAPVLASGVEKAALKLLPRAGRTRPALVAAFVGTGAGLALVFVGALGVARLLGSDAIGGLELAAGAFVAALGLNQMLVGLQRALGHPRRDVANFVALASATAVATLVAAVGALGPLAYLVVLLAAVTALNVWLLATIGPWALRPLRRRMLIAHAGATTVLMGVADVAGAGAVSALFLILSLSTLDAQTSYLFVTTSAAALLFGLLAYVLRVLQPQVSLAVSRAGGATWRRARRIGSAVVAGGSVYLAVVTVAAVLLFDVEDPPFGLPGYAPVLVLFVACLPIFLATALVNYLLENVDLASLRVTAAGSVGGLVGAVALGLVLVPQFGALGAVAALTGGEIVHAGVVLLRSAPQRSPAARAHLTRHRERGVRR